METFLKIYKSILKVCMSIFVGVLSLVIGAMMPELFIRLPDQPDVRCALDKITPQTSIDDLKLLLEDNGTCEIVYNCDKSSTLPEVTAAIWTNEMLSAQYRKTRFDWSCYLRFEVRGCHWNHEFDFYYDVLGCLCAIIPRRTSPYLEGNPTPWEWVPFSSHTTNSTCRCEPTGALP